MRVWVVEQQVFSEHPYDEGEQLVGLAADALTALGIVERDSRRSIDSGYDPVIYEPKDDSGVWTVKLEKIITTTRPFGGAEVPCTPYVTTDAVYFVIERSVEGAD